MTKRSTKNKTQQKLDKKHVAGIAITLFILLILLGLYNKQHKAAPSEPAERSFLPTFGLKTDTTKKTIDLQDILSGGPGKDGIPAINNPTFVPLSATEVADDARGILVALHGVRRFYPYSILVWHEIVNDTIGETPIAVTFCPLCDSGIVFDRRVGGATLSFGVSGLLFESNLLMYDTATESLWSQVRTDAVVGAYTGEKLSILPLQVITLNEVREKYPNTEVLSTDTGFSRNYTANPYAGYIETEKTIFPVSVSDKRFHAKEPMYVIPLGEKSVALPYRQFTDGTQTFIVQGKTLTITRDGGEITAKTNNKQLPGYFELWFSWATHHQKDGIVLTLKK